MLKLLPPLEKFLRAPLHSRMLYMTKQTNNSVISTIVYTHRPIGLCIGGAIVHIFHPRQLNNLPSTGQDFSPKEYLFKSPYFGSEGLVRVNHDAFMHHGQNVEEANK